MEVIIVDVAVLVKVNSTEAVETDVEEERIETGPIVTLTSGETRTLEYAPKVMSRR
ncbi:MAG: hypothetical protein ABSD99_07205 [Candidatus Bathyarchaeia archaeon]|jgi:hypothetical protein